MEFPSKSETNGKDTDSKNSNRYKRWTDEERKKVFQGLESSKSFKEIGQFLGRTEKAVELEFAKHVQNLKLENPLMNEDSMAAHFKIDKALITKGLQTKLGRDSSKIKEKPKEKAKNGDYVSDLIKAMNELNERNKKVIQLLEENVELRKENEILKKKLDIITND